MNKKMLKSKINMSFRYENRKCVVVFVCKCDESLTLLIWFWSVLCSIQMTFPIYHMKNYSDSNCQYCVHLFVLYICICFMYTHFCTKCCDSRLIKKKN